MGMRGRLVAMVPVLLLVSAPGWSQAVPGRDAERIANEGTIGDRWMLADGLKLATPTYPPAFADRGANVCVSIGYRIRPDGSTADMAVLKQWNSEKADAEPEEGFWRAFAEAGADALGQWRFKPRPEVTNPRTTYTAATLTFQGKDPPADLASHCRVADLAALVQQRKSDAYSRRSREKRDLEHASQAARTGGAMNEHPGRPE